MRIVICASWMLVIAAAQAVEVGTSLADLPLPLCEGACTVAAYKGQVVYLDIWATWCAPCHQSLPFMEKMHQRYGAQGLSVVAVSIDEKAADLDTFLARQQVHFTIGHDPAASIARTLAVPGMPTALLIDRTGVVHSIHKGFRAEDGVEREAQIQHLLAAQGHEP